MSRVVIGIFVGGAGKRMGGVAKGLLEAPASPSRETLIGRLLRVCQEALPDAALYLVGRSSAYATFELPQLKDDPAEVGPIGGLRSLLLQATAVRAALALALACDLPFIDAATLRRLGAPLTTAARPTVRGRGVSSRSPRLTRQARRCPPWDRALARGRHALMTVLEELGTDIEQIEGDEALTRALRDWDTPADVIG